MNHLKLSTRMNETTSDQMGIDTTFPAHSVKVNTPNGRMFVHILEDTEGNPHKILINIGKTGSDVFAWAEALAEVFSLSLLNGASIYDVLSALSNISSDRLVHSSGIPIYSGPDGLVQAILIYLKAKEDERYSKGESTSRQSFIRLRDAEAPDKS